MRYALFAYNLIVIATGGLPPVAISGSKGWGTIILSLRRESMQRAAGKRFVGFPDSSHDQRGSG